MRPRLGCHVLPVFGLLLAACSDLGTESFDPLGTSQKTQQVFSMVSNNPAVQGFSVLGPAFTWTGAPPALPLASPVPPSSPLDILPPAALGKTFIYSPSSGRYTTSGSAGAPSNGARFMLYQVQMSPKAVVQPLVEIGPLDLTNETSPTPNSLGVKAVVNNATIVDYKANGSAAAGNITLSAKGAVSDGTGRLEFELTQSFSQVTGVKVDVKLTPSTPDVTIQAVITAPAGSSAQTGTLTVTEGRNKLELIAKGSEASVEGTVEYNKHLLARISGTGANPVFTGQGGRVLSVQELDGLRNLFAFVDDLLEAFDDLLVPTYFVLGLGL